MNYIGIGFGTVAPLHRQKLKDYGVEAIGYIDIDPKKQNVITNAGLIAIQSYREAFERNPDFWVISTPPDQHLPVLEQIIAVDPEANIITEKPVCTVAQIPQFREIMKRSKGRVVVNENYLSSDTTKKIMDIVLEKNLILETIKIEMSKHRGADVKNGRYIDPMGAFSYEGTHMYTILHYLLQNICGRFEISDEIHKIVDDLEIDGKIYARQGSADISFKVKGIEVNLFSSMKGDIKTLFPPYVSNQIPFGDATRYRIAALVGVDPEGKKWTIVGFFEPIPGYPRSISAVAIFNAEGKRVQFIENIKDDTMGGHLTRAVEFFKSESMENPCTVEQAIEVTEQVERLTSIV